MGFNRTIYGFNGPGWGAVGWQIASLHAPVTLTATINETDGGILLSASEVSGADSYSYYYSVDGGSWQEAATGQDTDYTFTPTEAGSYSFAVTAVKGSSESAKTATAASGLFDDVPDSEGIALMAFYDATGGDAWTDNTGWMTDPTVGNWYGVTVSGGHVTEIDLSDNGLDNVLTETQSFNFLNSLPNMVELRLYSNASFGITFSIADNSTLTYLNVYNTDSNITGSIADNSTLTILNVYNSDSNITGSITDNSTLTILHVGSTNSNITGSIADNSTLTYLLVYNTDSNITGGSATLASYAYENIQLQDTAMAQEEVDEVLENIYRLRDNFTDATPVLEIHGNNAAPSGTYQYSADPSTGLEYAYALENDDDAEGFNKWSITYTAP